MSEMIFFIQIPGEFDILLYKYLCSKTGLDFIFALKKK